MKKLIIGFLISLSLPIFAMEVEKTEDFLCPAPNPQPNPLQLFDSLVMEQNKLILQMLEVRNNDYYKELDQKLESCFEEYQKVKEKLSQEERTNYEASYVKLSELLDNHEMGLIGLYIGRGKGSNQLKLLKFLSEIAK